MVACYSISSFVQKVELRLFEQSDGSFHAYQENRCKPHQFDHICTYMLVLPKWSIGRLGTTQTCVRTFRTVSQTKSIKLI